MPATVRPFGPAPCGEGVDVTAEGWGEAAESHLASSGAYQRAPVRRRYRGVSIGKAKRARIIAKHDGRCAICGAKPPKLTLDHILPRSKGGTQEEENLQPACARCNRLKGDS